MHHSAMSWWMRSVSAQTQTSEAAVMQGMLHHRPSIGAVIAAVEAVMVMASQSNPRAADCLQEPAVPHKSTLSLAFCMPLAHSICGTRPGVFSTSIQAPG